jgi:hypothetical protein
MAPAQAPWENALPDAKKLGVNGSSWRTALGVMGAMFLAATGIRYAPEILRPRADAGAETLPEEAAPTDLLAELVLPTPDASWSKLQRKLGGASALLPSTVPALFVAMSEFDARLARELDGTAPIVAAASGDATDPSVALLFKVLDSKRALAALTEGPEALFSSKVLAGGVLLVPVRPGGRATGFSLVLTPEGNLVALRREGDLGTLGMYLTRGLSRRKMSSGAELVLSLTGAGVERAIVPRLEAAWREAKAFLETQDKQMRDARGRAPDFGDPREIVELVDRWVRGASTVLSDVGRASIVVELPEEAVSLRASVRPRAPSGPWHAWLDGVPVGDAEAVLALPANASVAMAMRLGGLTERGDAGGASAAAQVKDALKRTLGPRLRSTAETDALFDAVAKADVASLAVSLVVNQSRALCIYAEVRDEKAAAEAMERASRLAEMDPFKGFFRVAEVTKSVEDARGLGRVSTLRVRREGQAPDAFEMAWLAEPRRMMLAGGAAPVETLRAFRETQGTLAGEPAISRFVRGLGKTASIVMVAQPIASDTPRPGAPSAGLGMAFGHTADEAYLRVEMANAVLREGLRRAIAR